MQPQFHKPRSVPYALCAQVEAELEHLEKAGIIKPVESSEWAAPVVPVIKRDGTIRVCGDYKVTANKAAIADSYLLPRVEDLFASLAGGQAFTKLDLAHAYLQLELDEASKPLLTINTSKGLFQYQRLPFGITSGPAIFQRTIESILQGLPCTSIYLDDILVTGRNEQEHLRNLEAVLTRLEERGVRLNQAKCGFLLPEVEYLGHRLSADGLRPTNEKVRAMVEAPAPRNVTQLRSFLGLVNYYGKFLPNLSTQLAPLYHLLQKHVKWTWSSTHEEAFQKVKELLTSAPLLVHYDPDKQLLLSCDASPYWVGAVLSHVTEDGAERPVAFASCSLSPAERNYSQLEREALSIVFGVKKFHYYLYGRSFTILSDHQPLKHLLSESRAIPPMASARIQRWALTLSAYKYTLAYKPGEHHSNADVLSRLPLPDAPMDVPTPGDTVLLTECLAALPLTASQIARWTDRDPVLAKVRDNIQRGWQHSEDSDLQPYQIQCLELTVEDGCVLWGRRVVVPPQGRARALELLHKGHPGASRMKGLARSFMWWPGMNTELEAKVKTCPLCQQHRKAPPPAPLHPWEWPQRPWSRLHADYAGPFMGRMFLVVVDSHSKWLEVIPAPSATSATTIELLRTVFATHGLPRTLVTDNGPAFTSEGFSVFMQRNGIKHRRVAPYHPSSNGLAERAVQTFKDGLKKQSSGSLQARLSRFLFQYRITPHSSTGKSPAELLMGRRLTSHLT